jgi:hypothetical protein
MKILSSSVRKSLIDSLELGLDIDSHTIKEFKPKNINPDGMRNLFIGVPESVKAQARILRDEGWKFYAVDSRCGACYYIQKVITIPCWALSSKDNPAGYKTWYISHEISHAIAWNRSKCADHGPVFMNTLKEICPKYCVHYELGYKPRNAKAAGIS